MLTPPAAVATRTALIVDDVASVRYYHSVMLRKAGFTCTTATNGREAVEILRRQPVDLLLVDIRMPEMGGEQMIATVRATPALTHIPIMVITTEQIGHRLRRHRTKEAGAIGFVNKPCCPTAFLQEVERLIRK